MRFRPSESDFEVEEVPLPGAPSSDEGDAPHTWVFIEKRGLSTLEAARQICARLGRSAADVGHAGLKDAHAVTRQWISLEKLGRHERGRIDDEQVRALAFAGAPRKIALGELLENRFRVRLRDVTPEDGAKVHQGLARMARDGVPNFFGRQRFGIRGLGPAIGKAILLEQPTLALDWLLGAPRPVEGQRLRDARMRYERSDYDGALRTFPESFEPERRALEALARGASPRQALEAVPWKTREVYLSAYQSELFNRLLRERVEAGTVGRVLAGDVVLDAAPGGATGPPQPRIARDAALEAEAARAFRVSPAGPLVGHAVLRAEAEPGRAEARLLASEKITWQSFLAPKGLALRGARRAYRFEVRRPEVLEEKASEEGAPAGTLLLTFALPPGCYATTLVEELGAAVE